MQGEYPVSTTYVHHTRRRSDHNSDDNAAQSIFAALIIRHLPRLHSAVAQSTFDVGRYFFDRQTSSTSHDIYVARSPVVGCTVRGIAITLRDRDRRPVSDVDDVSTRNTPVIQCHTHTHTHTHILSLPLAYTSHHSSRM